MPSDLGNIDRLSTIVLRFLGFRSSDLKSSFASGAVAAVTTVLGGSRKLPGIFDILIS